jgi:hypothetical protein
MTSYKKESRKLIFSPLEITKIIILNTIAIRIKSKKHKKRNIHFRFSLKDARHALGEASFSDLDM